MRGSIWVIVISAVLVGCASPAPTSTPMPDLPTLPLPAGVSGIPGTGDPTAMVEPRSPADSVPVGVAQTLPLGHCGLGSPIDFNAALWDPLAGDDGAGGALTDAQRGELINATTVGLTLINESMAMLVTPLGGRIMLEAHDGPRAYYLCD